LDEVLAAPDSRFLPTTTNRTAYFSHTVVDHRNRSTTLDAVLPL
jgi:hypothetical protein